MGMDHFEKLATLGKGSFGCVYKARRKTDGHMYAIKEVNIRNLSERERKDAVNEIRILASVKHKNIVSYCEAFVEGDALFIVMEFAERGDINSIIKKAKRKNAYVPEDTIWCYLMQICEGLNALHCKQILHRDLKPRNIFLTAAKHVRIGDLGCAKLMKTRLTSTQVGTPYYMAPEIWSKRPYDAKCDVWALGCIIHELCTLNPPFLANDMNGLASKVKTARTPRISKRYSDDLANLISRMLSKSVSSRPTIADIMGTSEFRKRTHLLPDNDDGGRWQHESKTSKILGTIKSPCYPSRKLHSSPNPKRRGNFTSRSSPARVMTSPPGRRVAGAALRQRAQTPTGGKLRLPNVPSLNQFPPNRGDGRSSKVVARGGIVTARDHYSKRGSKYVSRGQENGYRRVGGAKYHPRQPTAPSARRVQPTGRAYGRGKSRMW